MTRTLAALSLVFLASACYRSPGAGSDAAGDPDVPATTYSVTFVVENTSPETCSSCVYYLAYNYYGSPPMYGLGINYGGEDIIWSSPFCTTACASVTDPMWCCMDCAAPMPAVRQVVPGERIRIPWDGSVYTIDSEVCDCGCWWRAAAAAGTGRARICAYPAYTCLSGDECPVDAEGIVQMAEGDGEAICTMADFSFPADDGGEVVLSL